MKWLIYAIIIILCYLIFTHDPTLILYGGAAVILYWLFFKRSHQDPSFKYWQQEINTLKEHNGLLLQLIALLEHPTIIHPVENPETKTDNIGPNDQEPEIMAELEHLPIH